MNIAILCQPLKSARTQNENLNNEVWYERTHSSDDTEFRILWSRREIVGVSCGWTTWRDGWALWSAENTTLFELRRILSISATVADAEVMQAALDRWGIAAREQTHSMWAGAIWQKSRAELCFFRDRIGLTPAFFCQDEPTKTQVFSTSMSLIQELCPKSKVVNQNRLHAFLLCQNDTGRNDFFETVNRLLPGESWHLSVSNTRLESPEIRRYWHPGLGKSEISNQKDAAQFRS